ncbi:lipopolysaccharide-induced tumor necrosis factor-alpha factor [Mytilus galloprovincialis]|uniref:Lipopolysaccharide-induced tumor necrosis factor-alpha factor n=1 Tax=Mytilus galloprovincialis TaxID=29158 RepID=A0A8B6HQ44_MYTGA|nr:lipopolysaccharide-induced tumor necrosis factor-alpha factor [Mytilus galloprovincialis]
MEAQAPPPYGPPSYPQGQTQQTIVVAQPTVLVSPQYGDSPVRIQCPACKADVMTSTSCEPGMLAWIICLVLFFTGKDFVFWLCCVIPLCIDSCKDVTHTCPNCRHVVGKFSRM